MTNAIHAGFENYRADLAYRRTQLDRRRKLIAFIITLAFHVLIIGVVFNNDATEATPPRPITFEMKVVTPNTVNETPTPPRPIPPKPIFEKPRVTLPAIPAPVPVPESVGNPERKVEPPSPTAVAPAEETPPVEEKITEQPAPVTPASFHADYLNNPKPAYPVIARRMRLQGTVTLRVVVGPDGRAQDIQIAQTSGVKLLDDSAIDAVRNWLFAPARRGEEAISDIVFVPIRFKPE